MLVREMALSWICLPDIVGEYRRGNHGLDWNIPLRYHIIGILLDITRRPNWLALKQNWHARHGWQASATRSIWCLTVNPRLGFRNTEA